MFDDGFRKQPTLFDGLASVDERDRALAQVIEGQEPWHDKLSAYISRLRSGWRGSGEDVRRLWWQDGGEMPRHHNAWGSVIRQAIAQGYLRRTGRRVKLKAVKGHARLTDEYERV